MVIMVKDTIKVMMAGQMVVQMMAGQIDGG